MPFLALKTLPTVHSARPYVAACRVKSPKERSPRLTHRRGATVRHVKAAAVASDVDWDVVAKDLGDASPLIIMDHVRSYAPLTLCITLVHRR